ncbi:hypothetical protein QK408_30100, partial [Pseudomonas aeruginosa]|nr:hypothetical protein [Pseudomonas aeruginosa]
GVHQKQVDTMPRAGGIGEVCWPDAYAVAELERANIKARQMAGIERARAQGKKLGAPKVIDDQAVAIWRKENEASIADTAKHWGISTAAVKRACRVLRVPQAAAV